MLKVVTSQIYIVDLMDYSFTIGILLCIITKEI